MPRTDVVVLGGGPAGAAVAIDCATRGLRVILLERSVSPHRVTGEALHPDVAPLLARLGVGDTIAATGFLRYPGEVIAWENSEVFEPMVATDVGPAPGTLVRRAEFDAILIDRALALGVTVRRPGQATGPITRDGQVIGVATPEGPILARFTVDATGHQRVLGKWLAIPSKRHGPRRLVWSGLVTGVCPERDTCPVLSENAQGWNWVARVGETTYAWTHFNFANRPPAGGWVPPELRGMTPVGPARRHDVTWRLSQRPAGPGYFLVGDAAAVLDPASAHGILEALMSGILAADLIFQNLRRSLTTEQAAARYTRTVRDWYHYDVGQLNEFYHRLTTRPGLSPIPRLEQGCCSGVSNPPRSPSLR